jgi:hypothetical protein
MKRKALDAAAEAPRATAKKPGVVQICATLVLAAGPTGCCAVLANADADPVISLGLFLLWLAFGWLVFKLWPVEKP